MQKIVIQTKQMILFTFVPELIWIRCTSHLAPKIMPLLNSDFVVQFILVRFVIVTKGNRI